MADTRLGPVQSSQRLVHLDVLRGFALLGILLVNFEYFTKPVLSIMLGADPSLAGADRVADWWIVVLAEGKFYALFSLLFGAGFALIWEKAETAGRGFYGLYLRRLAILAAFGLAHGVFIWAGDILLVYALTGFVMTLLFRRTPQSRLPKWAVVFLALPVLLMWMFIGSFEMAHTAGEDGGDLVEAVEQQQAELTGAITAAAEIYRHGSWAEVTGQRLRDIGFLTSQALFWVPPVLGFFLLGRWMLISGRLRNPSAHADFFRRWTFWGLLAGGLLCLGATRLFYGLPYQVPTARLGAGMTLMTAGAPLLMLGYLSVVVRCRRQLEWLAPAGRMALTNYLLQSLFWTTLFYGYGLGLWGQIPRAWQPLLTVAFFTAQVAFSHWWMAHFSFGPAEWLWRSLTYMKVQPMRLRIHRHP